MPLADDDRAAVLHTMRAFRDTLLEVCKTDAAIARRVRADDEEAFAHLLELACSHTGLPRAWYEEALREDPCLLDLQVRSLREIFIDPPDPGPYSEISRESPAGTAENWHVHRWNGITPPGGVGGSGPPR